METKPLPRLRCPRTELFLPGPEFAPQMVAYYQRNEEHLRPWEPSRTPEFLTIPWWEQQLDNNLAEYQADRAVRLAILSNGHPQLGVVGVANLSSIVRGPFQACFLGYGLDASLEGGGYMFEALARLLDFAFDELGLHRVMANYRPENERSGRLLERLGFEREGYARDYLHINGQWCDHVLTARVRQ
jgi:[ribosomal protein S5]-alanine N-acetyltransferase